MGAVVFQLLTGGFLLVAGLLTAEYPHPARADAGTVLIAGGAAFLLLGLLNLVVELLPDRREPTVEQPAQAREACLAGSASAPPARHLFRAAPGRPLSGLLLLAVGVGLTGYGAFNFTRRAPRDERRIGAWVYGAIGVAGVALARQGWLYLVRWFRRRETASDATEAVAPSVVAPPGASEPDRREQVLREVRAAGGREAYINAEPAKQGATVPPSTDKPPSKADWKAQRDRRRAERIAREAQTAAERRAAYRERLKTEIPFVGEGVSGGLGRRQSDAAKLSTAGLPVLSTAAELAGFLGVTVPKLRWLCWHRENDTVSHYVYFAVPKKRGGERIICAPKSAMRDAQRKVLDGILSKIAAHPAAHGFVPDRGILSNASVHVGRDVVVNIDLKDFFPSITQRRVKGMFVALGYSEEVATLLSLLCTESPRKKVRVQRVLDVPAQPNAAPAGATPSIPGPAGSPAPPGCAPAAAVYWVAVGPRQLPQGACTSPAITNIICRRLDAKLSAFAERIGWRYTRYADDLTFSGSDPDHRRVRHVLHEARRYVEFEGFTAHPDKVRVQRKRSRQNVTGLTVNNGVGVCRRDRRRFRAILHNCARHGAASQNRRGHPDFAAWLRGYASFVRMVQPGVGARLVEQVERLLTGMSPPPTT